MDITINTPALLFPAISLVMLAYTNRFMAISSVIRNLHDRYKIRTEKDGPAIHAQIKNLRNRLMLIKSMQVLGVTSFLLAIVSMYFVAIDQPQGANFVFAASILFFASSLLISLVEIFKSTKSLELELSDMEDLDDNNIVDYLKNKIKGESSQT